MSFAFLHKTLNFYSKLVSLHSSNSMLIRIEFKCIVYSQVISKLNKMISKCSTQMLHTSEDQLRYGHDKRNTPSETYTSLNHLLGLVTVLYNCTQLCGNLNSGLHTESIFRGMLYYSYIIHKGAILQQAYKSEVIYIELH